MLFRFMQKCGLSSSRAYCIFLKSTNRNVENVLLLKSWMSNWAKPLIFARWAKIQYARDDERPHFCINLNKNTDSEVYCNANEFPNHASPLLTMVRRKISTFACIYKHAYINMHIYNWLQHSLINPISSRPISPIVHVSCDGMSDLHI
jgi:protease II